MGQTWDGITCAGTASGYTWSQANALSGTTTYASQNDWRLPNIRELQSIYDPWIDGSAFPNTPQDIWSVTSYAPNPNGAWYVYLYQGYDFNFANKLNAHMVRLVRAGTTNGLLNVGRPATDYVDNGDGTTSHTPTGLVWKKCSEGQLWSGGSCSGAMTSLNWNSTSLLTGFSTFAGQNDWRVPTREELLTLVDYSTFSPAINTGVFPNIYGGLYWSASKATNGGVVNFTDGIADISNVVNPHPVVLVRAGQVLNSFALTITKVGAGTVSGSALTGISCGNICTGSYTSGTTVILTATPAVGANFTGWSGDCSGVLTTCTVLINLAKNVTANFSQPTGEVSLSATSKTFVSQGVDSTSTAQTISLTNNGGATLNISSIAVTGDFAKTTTCGTTLAQGSTCNISVSFSPTTVGTLSGTIVISSDAVTSPDTINLSGTSVAVSGVTLSPTSLSFTGLYVGTSSAAQSISLTNSGGAALNLTGIVASTDYSQTNTCGSGLGAGGSCSILVTFTPSAAGARAGTISIASNAVGSPHSASLSGTGVALPVPTVTLSTTALSFTSQTISITSPTKTVSLSNYGTAALNISSIIGGGDFSQTNDCGSSLAVGSTCTLTLTFTPSIIGSRTAAITISSDSAGSPHSVSLSGTGTAPSAPAAPLVQLTSTLLSFGNQNVNVASSTQTVLLTNNGTATLNIASITTSGDFSQTNNCGSNVAASDSCTISVILTPTWSWARSGVMTISSNEANSPHTVNLTGTGVVSTALNFTPHWNLSGNSSSSPIYVDSTFNDATKVLTLYKWNGTTSKWAFYSPSVADKGAAYAASKGYEFLTNINAGEAFWVNAKIAFTVNLPSDTPIQTSHFQNQSVPPNNLPIGWSSIAVGDSPTPAAFNSGIGATSGASASNLNTLWAWDSVQANWYFYSPSMDANGTLVGHIASQKYLSFGSKVLDPSMGFWVNKP